jgi:hypothetical protein
MDNKRGKNQDSRMQERLSLYPLTPEQAMKAAMETPLPRSKRKAKAVKKAPVKKKG